MIRRRGAWLTLALWSLAQPALATTGSITDDGTAPPQPFTAICQITQTCLINGGCANLPAPGEMIVDFDGTRTAMGQRETDLTPLDRFAQLEQALPLPDLSAGRRSLLVDLPPEDADRRFALFVQRPSGDADPALQPHYFIMACRDATR